MQVDLYNEKDLILGCQRRDRNCQEMLYRRFSRKMYGICLSYAGNRDLAQDILHDAFIKIFNTISTFKMEGSLEGWIRRIVTNTAIDQLRKQQRLENFIQDECLEVAGHASDINCSLSLGDILKQVARLPEGARAIFNLFALEGLTHKEIASHLNISEGTSKSQYNRARSLLMQWIEKP
jgi:RNA polymerase sigma factor (sigma-70 family)